MLSVSEMSMPIAFRRPSAAEIESTVPRSKRPSAHTRLVPYGCGVPRANAIRSAVRA